MKTAKDPRHIQRIKVMQEIFSWQFRLAKKQISDATVQAINQPFSQTDQLTDSPDLSAVSQAIVDNMEKIDKYIVEAAPAWPITKINKLDLAVLRLAIYELFFVKNTPAKVVVDEAVELAKEYGSEASGGFVNGVIGTLIERYPNLIY